MRMSEDAHDEDEHLEDGHLGKQHVWMIFNPPPDSI